MKEIIIPEIEIFNEDTWTYSTIKGQTLVFEHSLKSLSKWESIYRVPFLSQETLSAEQIATYFKCMLVTKNVKPIVWNFFIQSMGDELNDLWTYVTTSQTATWFKEVEGKSKHNPEVLTSERLYYYMSALGINWEAQYWHLSRLIAIIRVGQEENKPKKQMTSKEATAYQHSINQARRAAKAAKK